MSPGLRVTLLVAAATAAGGLGIAQHSSDGVEDLRSAKSFSSIDDRVERSKALFVEAGKVILHPRCLNCHPADPHPRQGDLMAMHEPPVLRGDDNHGTPAMRCQTCHQDANIEHAGIPGHPEWHLAPLEMGWVGKSLGEICMQIKDVDRNGGKDLEEIHHHMAEDTLVGWGWNPGSDLEPAPGTQESFGELIRAWIDTGAHCPDHEEGSIVTLPGIGSASCQPCHDA